jgi:acetyl-CoA carboxylase biotin carboxyl carrier protein
MPSAPLPAITQTVSAAVDEAYIINNENAIKSPIVGTAYLSPSPSEPAFVSVGKQVNQGDVLMIIEAMKVMNPLKSNKSGIVKKILIEDGSPVEYGEVLMIIE